MSFSDESSSQRAGWLRGVGRTLWEGARSLVLVLVVLFMVRTFLVEAFRIPTSSMESTLLVGDFLLVNKAVYGAEIPGIGLHLPAFHAPERGEVLVFHPPHDPSKHYVKRLLGMPGDTLEMRSKVLWINGTPVEEPYAVHMDTQGDALHPGMRWQSEHLASRARGNYRPSRDRWGPLVVPLDHYFVLGDNRDNSEDSRYWGFVARDAIRGKPWRVYYSLNQEPRSEAGGILQEVRWHRIWDRVD